MSMCFMTSSFVNIRLHILLLLALADLKTLLFPSCGSSEYQPMGNLKDRIISLPCIISLCIDGGSLYHGYSFIANRAVS